MQQARLQGGRNQGFQILAPELRVGILARDGLALLGQAQHAVDAAGRLRQDRRIGGPAAAADRAAAPMEQA